MSKKLGFTLIELLVVIAIIAILAAILFPVFAQAREKARAITCVSNEKQIGLAVLQYSQDFDEYYPLGDNQPTYDNPWNRAIMPYVKNGDDFYGTGGMWRCPSFPSNQSQQYGARLDLFPIPGGGPQPGGGTYVQTAHSNAIVPSPASTVMIVEKGQNSANFGYEQWETREWAFEPAGTGCTDATIDTCVPHYAHVDLAGDKDLAITGVDGAYPSPTVYPRYRHQNTSNMLFCDGHVKAIHKGSLDYIKNVYISGLGLGDGVGGVLN